jgi:hypothetical protein
MWEQLPQILPFMIPILGILLGFFIVASLLVVNPIVKVLRQNLEVQQERMKGRSSGDQVQMLADRVESLEDAVRRLSEERSFDRELRAGPGPEKAEAARREAPPRADR